MRDKCMTIARRHTLDIHFVDIESIVFTHDAFVLQSSNDKCVRTNATGGYVENGHCMNQEYKNVLHIMKISTNFDICWSTITIYYQYHLDLYLQYSDDRGYNKYISKYVVHCSVTTQIQTHFIGLYSSNTTHKLKFKFNVTLTVYKGMPTNHLMKLVVLIRVKVTF